MDEVFFQQTHISERNGKKVGKTILVVDDNDGVRSLLASCLASSGYNVIEASGAVNAISILSVHTVDMVIADILMPHVDGFQLYRIARQFLHLQTVPFLFFLSINHDGAELNGMRMGVKNYLIKSNLSKDTLLDKVNRVLETSGDCPRVYADQSSIKASDMGFVQVIQLININKKTGTLTVCRGNEKIRLFFSAGNMVHVDFKTLSNTDMIYTVEKWEDEDINAQTGSDYANAMNLIIEYSRMSDERKFPRHENESIAKLNLEQEHGN